MSEYGYRPRARAREAEYRETTYLDRGPRQSRDLVYRPREDSVEDIPRDFPPPAGRRSGGGGGGGGYYEPRRTRSVGRHNDYYAADDDYSDRDGYGRPRRSRASRRDDGYYSDGRRGSPRRNRRKSMVGEVVEGLGLGSILGGVVDNRRRSRSRSRRRRDRDYNRDDSYSRSRSGSRSRGQRRLAQAAQAALVAGAVEAIRSRNEPGSWKGEKGRRVATAALSAGGIDGLVDKDPNRKEKRHLAEAVIGGLITNRIANGPRDRDRDSDGSRSGRSRSRSRAGSRVRSLSRSLLGRGRSESRGRDRSRDGGGGIKKLAAGGALAAAGKAIYDRVRSQSRRRRSPSSSSNDSYVPSRDRRYGRGNNRRSSNGNSNGRGGEVAAAGAVDRGLFDGGDSSSSVSTTDMEIQRRKMRGKELLTAGLATIATIHAAHGVYSSMEASEKRHKLVAEGEMSPEEARKKRSKAFLQDAAAVGIAALGIKGAFSEWKEMSEQRRGVAELEKKRRERQKRRQRRQREAQRALLMNASANPYGPNPAQPQGYYGSGPTSYADGNPYSSGNLPPPPMGQPPARY